MSNPPQDNTSESEAAGQNKTPGKKPRLPFGGKWAGFLFLIMLAPAAAAFSAELYLSCVFALSAPIMDCPWFGEGVGIPARYIKLYAMAGGFLLLWFAASFLIRAAKGGKLRETKKDIE